MNFFQRLFSKKKEERRPKKRPYNSISPSSLGGVMYPDDSSSINSWTDNNSPYTSAAPHTDFGGGSFGGGGASDSWDSSGSDSSSSDSGSSDSGSCD